MYQVRVLIVGAVAAPYSGTRTAMIENPYATPQSDVTACLMRNDFPDIPFQQLKKLRNNSHSIRALMVLLILVGGLGTIGCLATLAGERLDSALGGLAIAILVFMTGIGLMLRSHWGRILAFICSLFMLLLFPIGTIVGALSLGALGSKQLFGPRRINHRALEAEFRYRKMNKID